MKFVTDLYQKLKEQLNKIEVDTGSLLDKAKLSYQAVEAVMLELKTFITTYNFTDTAEEIHFFKELKPKFSYQLIYYIKLFDLETNMPQGAVKDKKKYLKRRLAYIKLFSEDNAAFYKYYRSGAVYMDDTYFVRNKFDIMIGLEASYFDCDKQFCTSHDYILATLLANEQLEVYLNHCLRKLNNPASNDKMNLLEDLGLSWAETKAAFVELLYGLQSLGAFYNTKTKSKADVKEIARFFEIALDMELGNYYRIFYDIKLRKKEPTSFTDRLKQGLIKRINEPDDLFR